MDNKDKVVLCSGGPDSYVIYKYLDGLLSMDRSDVRIGSLRAVYFDLFHSYKDQEKKALRRIIPKEDLFMFDLNIPHIVSDEVRNNFIIPGRNAFLILGAATRFPNSMIYLAVAKDEMKENDRSASFLSAMNLLLDTLGTGCSASFGFPYLDKTEWMLLHKDNCTNFGDIFNTWSCYKPTYSSYFQEYIHCGNCPACIRRYISFSLGFGVDETFYFIDPKNSSMAKEYIRRAEAGEYSEKRKERILGFLK